jgi:hypothetical protein
MNRTTVDRTRIDTMVTRTGTALGRSESGSKIMMAALKSLIYGNLEDPTVLYLMFGQKEGLV